MSALPPKADIRNHAALRLSARDERHPLAAQERCEIRNCFDDRGRLEPQFLGDLGGAALNPEGVQPGRRSSIDVPGIRGDEAEFDVRDFQALRRKIVDPRADLEDLYFFDANDIVEQIADTCALRRGL